MSVPFCFLARMCSSMAFYKMGREGYSPLGMLTSCRKDHHMVLTCSRYLFLPSSVLTTCLCTRLALLANELAISCYRKIPREELGYSSSTTRIIIEESAATIPVISDTAKLFMLTHRLNLLLLLINGGHSNSAVLPHITSVPCHHDLKANIGNIQ